MYQTHFRFRERPYPTAPDLASYYPASTHEQAIAQLQQGLTDGEAIVVLTGEPGTGKTLLCHALLGRLGTDVNALYLTNTHLPDRSALLQALLYDLSLPHEHLSEQQMRLALTEQLLQHFQAGQRTILVVDEAQHLTPELLEEIRLLGNLEARGSRALQVLLAGLPRLLDTLDLPQLASFRQRVVVRAMLDSLYIEEAADYLLHHLRRVAPRYEGIFEPEALITLARGSRGLPRLLNQLAHRALTLAYLAEMNSVDVEVALEALAAFDRAADFPGTVQFHRDHESTPNQSA